jgi:hypothetical protein
MTSAGLTAHGHQARSSWCSTSTTRFTTAGRWPLLPHPPPPAPTAASATPPLPALTLCGLRAGWRGPDTERGGQESRKATEALDISKAMEILKRCVPFLPPPSSPTPAFFRGTPRRAQCAGLLYAVHRGHRWEVHRNHRDGVPWHPLP